jgi:pseudaminic acid biosynthesis-associated methylase
MKKRIETPQEGFWTGDFGEDYIDRNRGSYLLASSLNLFNVALKNVSKPGSVLEIGANIGMNLKALKLLYPDIRMTAIEINKQAYEQLAKLIGKENAINSSVFDVEINEQVELTLVKGVLIHTNPDMLNELYQKIYDSSSKYIMIAEYYNPTPISIPYRGHLDRLFKRDFPGEMLKKFPTLKLVDYGFIYHGDTSFPQDDLTWFLLKK